jgi:membrane associated rhomboid family serine protease
MEPAPPSFFRQVGDWLRSTSIPGGWHGLYVFGVVWSVAFGVLDQAFQSSGFSIGVFMIGAVIGIVLYLPAVWISTRRPRSRNGS